MIGRKEQVLTLRGLLKSPKSEFVAVIGRRRVGKTFLIDTIYEDAFCFRVTGIQDAPLKAQLANFMEKLNSVSKIQYPDANTWQAAFRYLKAYCETLKSNKKRVLFFDELPWMYTPKSGFLQMLAHFWNDYLSKEKNFVFVICGSAASWIIKKVINDKGGLHNRLTEEIRLKPFTLAETKAFLTFKHIKFSDQNIALLYMAFGGIPHYLNLIRKGESFVTAIERLCFSEEGVMRNEYNNLYKALFSNASNHEAIVAALANNKGGITRLEIIKKSKIEGGGPYNRAMTDLMLSGFVTEELFFGRKKRGAIYRLNDEYSAFFHRFIKGADKYAKGIWGQLAASQAFKIWSGFAFETICFKHIDKIKEALGIANVYTQCYAYNVAGTKFTKGFQIDLIIDRKDDVINLCEVKFYADEFIINKTYAQYLSQRRQMFVVSIETKKQVHLTLITSKGLTENEYSQELIDSSIILTDLF